MRGRDTQEVVQAGRPAHSKVLTGVWKRQSSV